jgi:hypothetical protein
LTPGRIFSGVCLYSLLGVFFSIAISSSNNSKAKQTIVRTRYKCLPSEEANHLIQRACYSDFGTLWDTRFYIVLCVCALTYYNLVPITKDMLFARKLKPIGSNEPLSYEEM